MRSRALKLILLSLVCMILVLPAGPAAGAQSIDQVRATIIKAAYLYHLAALTTWPDSILTDPGATILIVVLGPDPHDLGGILATNTQDKSAGGHSLEVVCLPNVPVRGESSTECQKILKRCQILFITKEAEENFPTVEDCLQNRPVLTVGETEEFPDDGRGMVGFFIDEGRVRIKVCNRLASASGLKLSAEFLQHAILVGSQNGGQP